MTTEWIINQRGHVSILHLYQNILLHVLHINWHLIQIYLNQGICDGTHSIIYMYFEYHHNCFNYDNNF